MGSKTDPPFFRNLFMLHLAGAFIYEATVRPVKKGGGADSWVMYIATATGNQTFACRMPHKS